MGPRFLGLDWVCLEDLLSWALSFTRPGLSDCVNPLGRDCLQLARVLGTGSPLSRQLDVALLVVLLRGNPERAGHSFA